MKVTYNEKLKTHIQLSKMILKHKCSQVTDRVDKRSETKFYTLSGRKYFQMTSFESGKR